MADEAAFLIGDPDFDGWNLVMVADADGFCTKQVAFLGAGYKHDAVADAEGELFTIVHQGGDCQICQGEEGASLTDIPPIQVIIGDQHLGDGMIGIGLCYPATRIGCKAVCAIQ